MKNAVFYFSGTGNNLYTAKRIAEGLGNTGIYPIKDFLKKEIALENFERIIFCVPSYHSHIPNFVGRVIETMQFAKEQKIYSVVVCGGNRGHAVEDLREAIRKSGGEIFGEYMVMLPGSYILSYGAFPKLLIRLESFFVDRKINRIIKDILENKSSMLKKTGMFYRASDESRLQKAIEEYAIIGEQYTVSNQCKGCGSCAKVCPVDNITIKDGKPVFGQDCQQCMACIQWCPVRAIDYEGKALPRKRYHHPNIIIKDMQIRD